MLSVDNLEWLTDDSDRDNVEYIINMKENEFYNIFPIR